MLETKKELQEVLQYEKKLYRDMFGKYQIFLAFVKSHPRHIVWSYVKLLRITGYYYTKRKDNPYYSCRYFLSCRHKNVLGRKLGIELNEKTFDRGLMIYHTVGTVVNGDCQIGKDCKLHGNNCIGNDGLSKNCPVLGNNVRLGAGAKIIGDVYIANDIVVAAGAVVVNSFFEEGITIGGVPARKIK